MLVTRRSGGARALWLLGTLLQVVLPGAVAVADARLDAVGAHAAAHFESHTTKSCARIAAPECALCHFLTAPGVTAQTQTMRLALSDERVHPQTNAAELPDPLARPHPQPRAPPTLS